MIGILRRKVVASLLGIALFLGLSSACRALEPTSPAASRTRGAVPSRAALAERGLSLSPDGDVMDMEISPGSAGGSARRPEKKNPMVALLLSCVVPGWGEIYAGETTRGRWFMASEAAVWVGYGAFRLQADMREDDYTEYARIFAGVDGGASSDYLGDIADYIRSEGDDSYNQAIRAEARSLYPDDLDAQRAYLAEHGYFGEQSWDWESLERFREYRDLRSAASQSERYAFYMTGLALLNRALSAVDSAWMARRHNAGIEREPVARLSVAPHFDDGDVGGRATLELSF